MYNDSSNIEIHLEFVLKCIFVFISIVEIYNNKSNKQNNFFWTSR